MGHGAGLRQPVTLHDHGPGDFLPTASHVLGQGGRSGDTVLDGLEAVFLQIRVGEEGHVDRRNAREVSGPMPLDGLQGLVLPESGQQDHSGTVGEGGVQARGHTVAVKEGQNRQDHCVAVHVADSAAL